MQYKIIKFLRTFLRNKFSIATCLIAFCFIAAIPSIRAMDYKIAVTEINKLFKAIKEKDVNKAKSAIYGIVASGRNINITDDEGFSPLHRAAEAGHQDLVILLLENGADKTAANKQGKLPQDLTTDSVIKILLIPDMAIPDGDDFVLGKVEESDNSTYQIPWIDTGEMATKPINRKHRYSKAIHKPKKLQLIVPAKARLILPKGSRILINNYALRLLLSTT